ncbi:MAG: SDR family NAD(P)-dependent oxidoreductase, partial [Planctomycetota bacterium]
MARKVGDSTIVITGASSGIGRATALALASEGAAVVLAARREEPLERLASECEERGGLAIAVATDVTDEHAVYALAKTAIETFGRIDAWVNNAGVYVAGPFEKVPLDVWRRVLETNVLGVVNGCRAALPYMKEQGAGVLVNVASLLGTFGV